MNQILTVLFIEYSPPPPLLNLKFPLNEISGCEQATNILLDVIHKILKNLLFLPLVLTNKEKQDLYVEGIRAFEK